jgi:S-adenosylmethionine:tRNA ribosyltransferase-isomerase
MNLSEFDYKLPPESIAHAPIRPRDAARMLHVSDQSISDRMIRDLPDLLRPHDILVVNDTRVIPAQLETRRGEAYVGITLDQPLGDGKWRVLARNARRLRLGDRLQFEGGLTAEVLALATSRMDAVTVRFDQQGDEFFTGLNQAAKLALPPYIDRPTGPTAEDESDYQTLFAHSKGAVAAPTAGLHFTPALVEALSARDIAMTKVTLHVGAGTFLPVREDLEDITAHRMHAERGTINAEAIAAIDAARAKGGRVIAVGTTSLRVLETAARDGTLQPWQGETDLFILPGFRFNIVDLLLTNFHLPRSTLFMLVCAFSGKARMQTAYAHAIDSGYRFFSYGDATLLERT